jgi:hypothetical protein
MITGIVQARDARIRLKLNMQVWSRGKVTIKRLPAK